MIDTNYSLPKRPQIEEKTPAPDQRAFAVIPLHVLNKAMTLQAFRVLTALSSYCNKGGFTYVSLHRLANDLGVSASAISQTMQRLQRLGIVKKVSGHYTMIKGATRRIIYDDKITDEQASKVSNSEIEPYKNKEISNILQMKRINKANEIANTDEALRLKQTREDKSKLIASLFECVSNERELVRLEKLIEAGACLVRLKTHIDKGCSIDSFNA